MKSNEVIRGEGEGLWGVAILMTEQSGQGRTVCMPSMSIRPLALISVLLLFALSFEAVPLPIQAQIIPLTSLLALLFLPFTIRRIRLTFILKLVMAFAVFVMLYSLVALFVDIVIR